MMVRLATLDKDVARVCYPMGMKRGKVHFDPSAPLGADVRLGVPVPNDLTTNLDKFEQLKAGLRPLMKKHDITKPITVPVPTLTGHELIETLAQC